MITPAYSPTATERVLPRMALDFTTGVLDSRVTVARALNTATRINSSGLVEGVNANLPRFDYDPVTLAPRGLLIEEARANLLLQSSDLTQAAWVLTNATATLTAIGPDGATNSASVLTSTAGNATALQSITSASAARSTTCYIKRRTGSGVVEMTQNNGTTWTAINVTSSWTRVSIASATLTNPVVGLRIVTSGDAVDVALFQCETGAFATSAIPTTTTSLTRNADVVSMTGTNFSSWYNASEGAFVVEALRYDNVARTAAAFDVDDGTAANYIQLSSTATSGRGIIRVSSGTAINLSAGSAAVTTPAKLTIAYKNASFAFSSGGAAPATNAASAVPTVSQALIGSGINGSYLNGAVSKVMYWPQRLINAEVQSFSK